MSDRNFIDALLYGWNKNTDYVQRLMADIPADKIAYQPAANMNHPAWILSHLNIYHPCMVGVITQKPFEDPKGHKFGMTSKPEANASLYGSKDALVAAYVKGHNDVAAALQKADPKVLAAAPNLERWAKVMPTTGILLNYLMLLHESTHLGQLSAWRRVQGMPSV
jgi:hypothetical protein